MRFTQTKYCASETGISFLQIFMDTFIKRKIIPLQMTTDDSLASEALQPFVHTADFLSSLMSPELFFLLFPLFSTPSAQRMKTSGRGASFTSFTAPHRLNYILLGDSFVTLFWLHVFTQISILQTAGDAPAVSWWWLWLFCFCDLKKTLVFKGRTWAGTAETRHTVHARVFCMCALLPDRDI